MNGAYVCRGAMGVVLLAGLAGCGSFSLGGLNPWAGGPTERARTDPADATVYACSDAKRLVVRYLPGSTSVMIIFREREFRLDRAPSAPERYSNGSTTLLAKGELVFLEEDGTTTYFSCRKPTG